MMCVDKCVMDVFALCGFIFTQIFVILCKHNVHAHMHEHTLSSLAYCALFNTEQANCIHTSISSHCCTCTFVHVVYLMLQKTCHVHVHVYLHIHTCTHHTHTTHIHTHTHHTHTTHMHTHTHYSVSSSTVPDGIL